MTQFMVWGPSRINVRESPCEATRLTRLEWLDGSWHIALSSVRDESAPSRDLNLRALQAKFANPAKEDGCAPLDEIAAALGQSRSPAPAPTADGWIAGSSWQEWIQM